MFRLIFAWLFLALTVSPAAFSEPAEEAVEAEPQIDTIACEIYRERKDWFSAARQVEKRWGLPVSHQLALLSEEWRMEQNRLPSNWQPAWASERPLPGLPEGYFEPSWRQFKASGGKTSVSPQNAPDLFEFMGWYFSSLGARHGIGPNDPQGQYTLWRTGGLTQNAWHMAGANQFAERVAYFEEDLTDCTNPYGKTPLMKAWDAVKPIQPRPEPGTKTRLGKVWDVIKPIQPRRTPTPEEASPQN